MKFSGICFITKDVLSLSRFYMRLLGVEAEGNATHMELKMEGAGIAIFSYEGMEDMAPGSMTGAGFGSFTVTFEVDDVDSLYEKVLATGVPIVKTPQTHPWGWRSFWFRDPDGNIVNFAQQVKIENG